MFVFVVFLTCFLLRINRYITFIDRQYVLRYSIDTALLSFPITQIARILGLAMVHHITLFNATGLIVSITDKSSSVLQEPWCWKRHRCRLVAKWNTLALRLTSASLFVAARLWKAIYQLFMETLVLIYAYTNFELVAISDLIRDHGFVAVYSLHRKASCSLHFKTNYAIVLALPF